MKAALPTLIFLSAAMMSGPRAAAGSDFTGSVDALRDLNAGRCAIAGFHLPPRTTTDSLIARTYKPLLHPDRQQLIGFARRVQGLAVARGNPLDLHTIADVVARGARFVNRPTGTGTRLLLDALCEQHGVARSTLIGYENEEPSHAAVAQAVAAGQADVGLCIEAAARSRDLDFVPLLWEQYFLVCDKTVLGQAAIRTLQAVLRSESWLRRLSTGRLRACTERRGAVGARRFAMVGRARRPRISTWRAKQDSTLTAPSPAVSLSPCPSTIRR
jgi:molybdate-binding protein